jgi:hypothetical protein
MPTTLLEHIHKQIKEIVDSSWTGQITIRQKKQAIKIALQNYLNKNILSRDTSGRIKAGFEVADWKIIPPKNADEKVLHALELSYVEIIDGKQKRLPTTIYFKKDTIEELTNQTP